MSDFRTAFDTQKLKRFLTSLKHQHLAEVVRGTLARTVTHCDTLPEQ